MTCAVPGSNLARITWGRFPGASSLMQAKHAPLKKLLMLSKHPFVLPTQLDWILDDNIILYQRSNHDQIYNCLVGLIFF